MNAEQFMSKTVTALDELEGYGMLEAYAAHAAAKVLVDHWKDAARDGVNVAELLTDVDRTIKELQAFKGLMS